MTSLLIFVDATTVTAVEKNFDNVRYVETFNCWAELFHTLEDHMDDYAEIIVRRDR